MTWSANDEVLIQCCCLCSVVHDKVTDTQLNVVTTLRRPKKKKN
jgi:hypothetical protein